MRQRRQRRVYHFTSGWWIRSPQQKFCRACGFGLEKVAQLLEESGLFAAGPEQPDEIEARQRFVEKLAKIAFYVFATTLGAGFLTLLGYGVVYKIMIESGNVIPG